MCCLTPDALSILIQPLTEINELSMFSESQLVQIFELRCERPDGVPGVGLEINLRDVREPFVRSLWAPHHHNSDDQWLVQRPGSDVTIPLDDAIRWCQIAFILIWSLTAHRLKSIFWPTNISRGFYFNSHRPAQARKWLSIFISVMRKILFWMDDGEFSKYLWSPDADLSFWRLRI